MAFLDHEGGAEFPYARDDVFEALVRAIPSVPGLKVDAADKLAGRVLAKAGVSLWSLGENIPISVVEVSPGRTRVSVTSTPKTGALLGGPFDFGKNRKNVERILGALSQLLSQKPPAPQAAARPAAPNVEDRLLKLQDLREKGLITSEEFEKRKGEILSEI